MKDWTVNCLGASKPKIFLDTNILSYLIDETYPSLNCLLQSLKDTCLFDLVSSDYCKSEFVGIRKREHYLRLSVQKAQEGAKAMNFSSLLKYHNQFGSKEVPFESIIDEIRDVVQDELQKITTDYGIDFCCKLNSDIASLANDICLCSKISKEDSIVMASSVIPRSGEKYDNVLLLTHDKDFVSWYHDSNAKSAIDEHFQKMSVNVPSLIDTRAAFGFNLDETVEINEIKKQFVQWFVERFEKIYIGKSVSPVAACPSDCFAIKARCHKTIYQDSYVFVIGHDLDFMYAIPNTAEFYHKNERLEHGHEFVSNGDCILCAKMPFDGDAFDSKHVYNEILQALRENENYVFYLPIE